MQVHVRDPDRMSLPGLLAAGLLERRLRSGRMSLRGDVLLVLDAAYAEYQESPDYDSGIRLVRDGAENVVVTRTFSSFNM